MRNLAIRNSVMGGSARPYDAEVEYIESTGTQRISTNINIAFDLIDNNPPFEVFLRYSGKMLYHNTTTRQLNGLQGGFYVGPCNGKWQCGGAGSDVFPVQFAVNTAYDFECNFFARWNSRYTSGQLNAAYSYQILKVNGNEYTANNIASIKWDGYLSLFSLNNQILPSSCRIYYWEINNYDNILFDIIPVRFTNSLGQTEGAMFDKVSKRLFRNAGTGAFVVGPDKVSQLGGGLNA